jgi:short-subunit dehydrogenase
MRVQKKFQICFSGNFTDISWKNNCMCTELNCTAIVKIIGISLPYMKSGGRIVQLASAAAFFPQPGFAVYAATKAFVFNFSRALGRELAPHKISVTTACPGPCDTEFLKLANGAKKMPLYKRAFIAKAPKVARKILNSAVKGRKLCLPGGIVKLLYVARKILPAEWIMFFQQNAH